MALFLLRFFIMPLCIGIMSLHTSTPASSSHLLLVGQWTFKYLGSIVAAEGGAEADCKNRVRLSWNKWRETTGVSCDKKVPVKLKVKIYQTVIKPTMLYGAECWAMRKKEEHLLNKTEMRMLRWIQGISLKDHVSIVRSEEIRKRLNVMPIVDQVTKRRLSWYGNIKRRKPEDRKQLRTFTCKSIKIIAPILLVCIELNPGPPKCYLCRKSIKTNDKKLIQCDHCSNSIHRNCCDIDDSEYRQLVHSACSWACPECNHFNFSNSFFDNTEILTSNQFGPLDNVNQTKTNNPQPSKNARNNKGHKAKKRSNLRCILINCQSIRKKAADIEVGLLNSLHKPDFICGTESWLNPSIKNGEIFPTSFTVFRKDRDTSIIGGGVFQISNEDLITSQLDNLCSANSESIWTETQIKGISPIVICTFYRPPKDAQGFQLDELDQALSKLGNKINTPVHKTSLSWGILIYQTLIGEIMPLSQIVVTVQ